MNFNSDDIKAVESLSDTPFGILFHQARTTSPLTFTTVSVAVKTDANGHIVDVGDVVKTRQGTHHHVRNSNKWDSVISLPIRPFMETTVAKRTLRNKLQKIERRAQRPTQQITG